MDNGSMKPGMLMNLKGRHLTNRYAITRSDLKNIAYVECNQAVLILGTSTQQHYHDKSSNVVEVLTACGVKGTVFISRHEKHFWPSLPETKNETYT